MERRRMLEVVLFSMPGVEAAAVEEVVALLQAVPHAGWRVRRSHVVPERVEAAVEAARGGEDPAGAVLGWEMAFRALEGLAREEQLGPRDAAVLMSDWPNTHNWFSFANWKGDVAQTIVLHTAGWHRVFPEGGSWLPWAHLVASNVLHGRMFRDMGAWTAAAHGVPRGCLMDACRRKEEIRLKMLAADLCADCAAAAGRALEAGWIDRPLLLGALTACDQVRRRFAALERESLFRWAGRVRITRDLEVHLEDWGGRLKLGPRDCAVYIALLEGHRYTPDPDGAWQRAHAQLRHQLNLPVAPLDAPAFNQSVSRIRRVLRAAVPADVADRLLWTADETIRRIGPGLDLQDDRTP